MSRKDRIPFGAAAIRNKDSCIVLWVRMDVQFNSTRVGSVIGVGSGQVGGQRALKYPERPQ